MLPIANPALDLHVLQLLLRIVFLRLLLLPILLPRDARLEDYVLAYGGGVEGWTGRVVLLEPEFGPGPPLCDAGVDGFFDDGGADAARGLYAFAVVVEAVGCYCFGAIFVGGHLLRGQRGGGGVVEV